MSDHDFIIKMRAEKMKKDYESSGYPETVTEISKEEIMLPMRDGKRMRTILYKPTNTNQYPVIFRRTCYPNDEPLIIIDAENFSKRGYCFIYQFCRGTGGSEGTWLPNINEREDGIDMVNWICNQPWCESLGYWGLSYSSLTGWIISDCIKGKVNSMFLLHYGTDRFISAYHKGLFHHDILTGWSMQNAGFPIKADYEKSCLYMPQIEVDENLWGHKLNWYRDYVSNEYFDDDYWQNGLWKNLREIPKSVEIPMYIVSGWYDHHHESTMKTWAQLNCIAKNMSWLEIGGWNHGLLPVLQDKITENLENVEVKKALNWFDITLKKKIVPKQKVRFYVPGKDCWMEADSWENIKRKIKPLYLIIEHQQHEKNAFVGSLDFEIPKKDSSINYIYDPSNPVHTNGGDCTLCSWNLTGSLKQKEPGYRQDVLSFISKPFEQEMILNGKIDVELWVKSDCENTAFVASIDEVTPDGNAYHIRTSATTIKHELPRDSIYKPNNPLKVIADMSDICYAISKGSSIRVDITSSDFPQYSVNRNQAGQWALIKENKIAHQTILTGVKYPSCVKLSFL